MEKSKSCVTFSDVSGRLVLAWPEDQTGPGYGATARGGQEGQEGQAGLRARSH